MYYYLYKTVKHQTEIKGYWKDKTGKIFVDNIDLIVCNNKDILKDRVKELFRQGEQAVFYKDNVQGVIEDKNGNIQELKTRHEKTYKSGYDNIKQIKEMIDTFNGCTVYHSKGYITIEVFTN